jgi:Rrf2 family protein
MVLNLAENYNEGPVQIGQIAKQLEVSVKYLEQLIIPLKKADLIKSVRGPKGGHKLAKPPDEVTVGDIVRILEGGIDLSDCISDPKICRNTESCVTRSLWQEATDAMYDKLDSTTFADMIERVRVSSS